MKTKHLMGLTALTLILAAGWLGAARAENRLAAKPTAVAVVDIQKAFDALAEKDQIEADLRTKAEQLKQLEDDKKKKIRDIQADLEILAPDTEPWLRKKDELDKALIELQVWRTFETNNLNNERGVQVENLYRKMIDSIGKVAKANGYDVVLFKEKPVRFAGAKPEQIPALIQVRKVLWAADELDLTDQVITDMNNQFKNSPGAGVLPPKKNP